MITLPWPPSLNRYYRTHRGRVLVSQAGREYHRLVSGLALASRWPRYEGKRLRVEIESNPPTARKYDLDNQLKCLLDTLQKVGVIDDDERIDDLRIFRGGQLPGGQVTVRIETA